MSIFFFKKKNGPDKVLSPAVELEKFYYPGLCTSLFYNQEILFMRQCTFLQGLSGIIHNSPHFTSGYPVNTTLQKTFNNITFNSSTRFDMESFERASISIIECLFQDIQADRDDNIFDYNFDIIQIANDRITLYMTDTTFYRCFGRETIVSLQRCRYPTITHTCCINCETHSYRLFLYIMTELEKISFSVFTAQLLTVKEMI